MLLECMRIVLLGILVAAFFKVFTWYKNKTIDIPSNLLTMPLDLHYFCTLFSTLPSDIAFITQTYIHNAQRQIKAILSIPLDERTFSNTAQALDHLTHTSDLALWLNVLLVLKETHPDEKIRMVADENVIKIQDFYIEHVSSNKLLFNAFKEYVDNGAPLENLVDEERYFLEHAMQQYIRSGITLPDDERLVVINLQKDLAALSLEFEKNISHDNSFITLTKDDLRGVTDSFLVGLKQNDDGLYIVKTDYPTASTIMDNVEVEETRKRFFIAFNNRGYPANDNVLKKIMSKRYALAHALGFPDYASFDLADQMVGSSKRAYNFLQDLYGKAQKKAVNDIALLVAELPAGVALSHDGNIKPWDMNYVQNKYKQRVFAIDENKIAEYFPLEHTITQLLGIYTQFLGITFEEMRNVVVWHPDVRVIGAYDNHHTLLGYLFLDLFPREFKYSHACHASVVPALRMRDGNNTVSVSVVIANFSPPTKEQPSLLKRNEVDTFFHEFGHALHALCGATQMGTFSGTNTKTDFVELPSQILEEWLFDPGILRKITCHFETKAPLPDEVIRNIVAIKRFASGILVNRQLFQAMFSLDIFNANPQQDPQQLWSTLASTMQPYIDHSFVLHGYASFGHLTDYGAKYYCYLWSQVFALDLFSVIKKEGLLNPVVGKRYKNLVIAKGGSKDPNKLLYDFLQREPDYNAYFKEIGFI